MDKKNFVRTLQQIKTLVDSLLKETGQPASKRTRAKAKTISQSDPKFLTDHILKLRDEGRFSQPLTFQEVHSKLAPTYPCDASRVKVACFRLQKRKMLRKTSKLIGKKKQAAYVW